MHKGLSFLGSLTNVKNERNIPFSSDTIVDHNSLQNITGPDCPPS